MGTSLTLVNSWLSDEHVDEVEATDDVCEAELLGASSLVEEELHGLGESISVSSSLSRPLIEDDSGVVAICNVGASSPTRVTVAVDSTVAETVPSSRQRSSPSLTERTSVATENADARNISGGQVVCTIWSLTRALAVNGGVTSLGVGIVPVQFRTKVTSEKERYYQISPGKYKKQGEQLHTMDERR